MYQDLENNNLISETPIDSDENNISCSKKMKKRCKYLIPLIIFTGFMIFISSFVYIMTKNSSEIKTFAECDDITQIFFILLFTGIGMVLSSILYLFIENIFC